MQREDQFETGMKAAAARMEKVSQELKRRREAAAAFPNNLGNYRPRAERPTRSPKPRGPIHRQVLSIILKTSMQSAMRDRI
jgi:hypothetical protein